VLLLVLCGGIGFADRSSAAIRSGSYVALKAGVYSPSSDFTLDNLDIETTFDTDTKTGFDGEIALGHYVLPTLAVELGVGYFKTTGTVPSDGMGTSHSVDIGVVPVIASLKALIPVGPLDPYGEAGIGAYVTQLDVGDDRNDFGTTTTFGIHAGGGVNINLSPKMFVGAEGRYVWADPSIGGERIDLNPETYAVSEFKLNGFTTTLVLGFGF
jgi:opacity protein-like surface antigen